MKTLKLLSIAAALASLPTNAADNVAVVVPDSAPAVEQQSTTSTTSQYVDDATITTKVKSTLIADKDTSGTAIKVETDNGTVVLSGNVKTAQEKMRAVDLAKKIDGVKDVKDQIQVN